MDRGACTDENWPVPPRDRKGEAEDNNGSCIYDLPPVASGRIQIALGLLVEAAKCAGDVGADVWQFSVEVAALRRAGLSTTECRWLTAKGLAKHACEITTNDSENRVFQPCSNLALPRRACFVITERGIAYAKVLLGNELGAAIVRIAMGNMDRAPSSAADDAVPYGMPRWDSDRQQLRVAGVIVKEFKVPAANQEAILAAFQEENWAPRIDDPLIPKPNLDTKRRLRDTINCLNRKQKNPLMRFHGDGRGEGVRWEFIRLEPSLIGLAEHQT